MTDWTLWVRDAARQRIGQVTRWSGLTCIQRFNDVGAYTVKLGLEDPVAADLLDRYGTGSASDLGLIVYRDGEVVMSGPVKEAEEVWGPGDEGAGSLNLAGVSDEAYLTDRLAYQVPSQPAATQAAASYDAQTGQAEALLYYYVRVNAGFGARAERRISGLTFAPDLGRGGTVSERARMDDLLELCQRVATAGGDLGFRVRQDGEGLMFEVYEPVDRRDTVKLSKELGTISAYSRKLTRPDATALIVGGGDSDLDRVFAEGSNTDAVTRWGRIEDFLDRRDTMVPAELTEAATAELREKADQHVINVTVRPDRVVYGVDYNLGDRVTVVAGDTQIVHQIREVELRADDPAGAPATEHGASRPGWIKVRIGPTGAQLRPRLLAAHRAHLRRLTLLERRK